MTQYVDILLEEKNMSQKAKILNPQKIQWEKKREKLKKY